MKAIIVGEGCKSSEDGGNFQVDEASHSIVDETTGDTVLHAAVRSGQEQIASVVLTTTAGLASIKQCNKQGLTPLALATQLRSESFVKTLLQYDADPLQGADSEVQQPFFSEYHAAFQE